MLTSRREWLARCGAGVGALALADLLARHGLLAADVKSDPNPLAPRRPHFDAKAKAVIWIFINGGPSQVDTWDYKPALEKWDGKSMKAFDPTFQDTTGFFKDQVGALMKSPFAFTPRGASGKMVSELFPNLGEHVDKMAF